jgi:hypothetical protein
MTIQELHDQLADCIAKGHGSARVGVNLSTFPSPDDDGIVMPASGAGCDWLESAEETTEPGHWLVIEG